MICEEIVYVCTSDLSGLVRGKGVPASDFANRLHGGVGWVPTNAMITCFDAIADGPFGSTGDLVLRPDPGARARVDFGDGEPAEHFALGDVLRLDGTPWSCCPRGILKAALRRLEDVAGLAVNAAFEQEFQLPDAGGELGAAFGLGGFGARRALAGTVVAALRAAGLAPESVLREYGDAQFEVTLAPEPGVRAADAAAIARELVRAAARRRGERASFTPIRALDGVGNGVHVHLGLVDAHGRPAMHDASRPHGLSEVAGAFVAGVLRRLPEIVALTAPSAISHHRLVPHRWSAAFNNLGVRDREAAVRICPVTATTARGVARQYHVEFRAADAAATPHLALAAIVHAGAEGIADALPAPVPTEGDLDALDEAALEAAGVERLPGSLEAALARLEASEAVGRWMGEEFRGAYLDHKRGELAFLEGLDDEARLAAYGRVY